MFSVNKKGRNYQKSVPLSSDMRNQVKELVQDHSFSDVGQRLHISKGVVSKVVKQCNLTGSTAPKKLNHVRTVPKCTFQDSILLETMVQASASSSLKELRDDLAIHGDWRTVNNNFQKYWEHTSKWPQLFTKKVREMCVRAFYSRKYSVHSVVY